MIETILTRLGVFLALCGTFYGCNYIYAHPGLLETFWGLMMIVNGSVAFFYLSSLGDRHDEDYNDDDHDPY